VRCAGLIIYFMVMTIQIKNGQFVDEHQRILNLRGVNLSGSSKIPSNGNTLDGDPKSTTFVNRPFPLSEAPQHFARLRACGFNFVRFIVTWEAIEHSGAGLYDSEYLQYVRQIIEKAREFGIQIYIDPHQDVWSRWTGGDGAPLWTLELVGFDVKNFRECEAAVCSQTYGQGHSTDEKKGSTKLPKMIWPTNYFKMACATMFTLFWAGERFAPHFQVADEIDTGSKVNIQTYLQTHYINAMAELLKHLRGLDNVVGIGTMNEPSPGYINVDDVSCGYVQSVPQGSSSSVKNELRSGLAPTPFQGWCLGEGIPQLIDEWSNGLMQHVLGRQDRSLLVDPKGKRAWSNSNGCVWKKEKVWHVNPQTRQPELLLPKYFANVDFGKECYLPFASKYAKTMQQIWASDTKLLIFVELPPLEFSSTPFPYISSSGESGVPDAVNATHWYDGVTLFRREWKSYFSLDTRVRTPILGYNKIFKTHASQLAEIKQLGVAKMNNAATIIGETGIPFDMLGNENWDSFGSQLAALDHTLRCLENNLLSFTLWNYTADNSNAEGDRWNGEDLSLFSEDQKQGLDESDPLYIYDGVRAARAAIRPYAMSMVVDPLVNTFDSETGLFTFRGVIGDTINDLPTEIFVPKFWSLAESDMQIRVSGGKLEVLEHDHWFIVQNWYDKASAEQKVEIKFTKIKELPKKSWKLPFV
jgi:hypothetical protein